MGATSMTIAGGLLFVILLRTSVTSVLHLDKKSFETFYFVHHFGFSSFFVLIIMHGSHDEDLKKWMYVAVPAVVYFLDRAIRLRNEHNAQILVGYDLANIKSPEIVLLRLSRLLDYQAGQYCDVCVVAVSSLRWQPFTIAYSPYENEMRFYIKANCDWTKAMHKIFSFGFDEELEEADEVEIEDGIFEEHPS